MRGVALMVLAAMLSGCAAPQETEKTAAAETRVRVLAADLFELDGEKIRLANVSAPQPSPAAHCWAEAALAHLAKEHLAPGYGAPWIAPEDIERVGRDPDGVTRATIRMGDEDLGENLIRDGYAARWTAAGWDWCSGKPDTLDANAPVLGMENQLERWKAKS